MTATLAPRAPRTAAWRSRFSAPTRVTPYRRCSRNRPPNRRRLNNRSNSIAGRAMPSFSVGWVPFGAPLFLCGRAGAGAVRSALPDVQSQKAGSDSSDHDAKYQDLRKTSPQGTMCRDIGSQIGAMKICAARGRGIPFGWVSMAFPPDDRGKLATDPTKERVAEDSGPKHSGEQRHCLETFAPFPLSLHRPGD